MRKFIAFSILLATIQLKGIGQIDSEQDSICFDMDQNKQLTHWVEERDEFYTKNVNLKMEVSNLEFSYQKCKENIFEKDKIILNLRAVNNIGYDQFSKIKNENIKLRRKVKRRNWLVYGVAGAGIFGILSTLFSFSK